MQASNPLETLSASIAHAAYQGFSIYEYEDRDWKKYRKWSETVFDKLTKEEKAVMYDEERKTGIPMGPAECRVKKTRRHDPYNVTVYAMFIQTWGSTALGFGGIGGQAFTSAYVCVLESTLTKEYAVYFGGRFAYLIKRPNQKFFEDVANQRMVDAAVGVKTYEMGTENV